MFPLYPDGAAQLRGRFLSGPGYKTASADRFGIGLRPRQVV